MGLWIPVKSISFPPCAVLFSGCVLLVSKWRDLYHWIPGIPDIGTGQLVHQEWLAAHLRQGCFGGTAFLPLSLHCPPVLGCALSVLCQVSPASAETPFSGSRRLVPCRPFILQHRPCSHHATYHQYTFNRREGVIRRWNSAVVSLLPLIFWYSCSTCSCSACLAASYNIARAILSECHVSKELCGRSHFHVWTTLAVVGVHKPTATSAACSYRGDAARQPIPNCVGVRCWGGDAVYPFHGQVRRKTTEYALYFAFAWNEQLTLSHHLETAWRSYNTSSQSQFSSSIPVSHIITQ